MVSEATVSGGAMWTNRLGDSKAVVSGCGDYLPLDDDPMRYMYGGTACEGRSACKKLALL